MVYERLISDAYSNNTGTHNPQATNIGGLMQKTSSMNDVRASLQENGAPEISEEDFARLYKGRMVEVLDLVARNVVGRNHVASARTAIQQYVRHIQVGRTLYLSDAFNEGSASHQMLDRLP